MKKDKKNLKFFALTIGTCAAAIFANAQNVQAQTFSEEQTKELEVIFKKFLADNPEDILNSVENFRTSQEKQAQQSTKENLVKYKEYFADKTLPMAGNPDGDVTVVEYFDYNCGYCRKAFADLKTLIGEDKNLRVVFQEMPILSPTSQTMAKMSLAAHKQGKYFEMHQALMDYKGSQSSDAYDKVAEKVGVDVAKLNADAKTDEIEASIKKSAGMGRDLGIRGTPGFVIGDEIYPGYIGLDGLKKAIADARAAKK